MTEKRFILECDSNTEWLMQIVLFLPIKDKNTNKKITLKQCLDLLNEYEYLNQEMGNLGTTHAEEIGKIEDEFNEEILELEKENKQLQRKYNKQLCLYNGIGCEYDWLKDENEQLKHRIKKLQNKLNHYSDFFDELSALLDENEQLYELINFANTLIAFEGSESCQAEWKKRLKELEDLE